MNQTNKNSQNPAVITELTFECLLNQQAKNKAYRIRKEVALWN